MGFFFKASMILIVFGCKTEGGNGLLSYWSNDSQELERFSTLKTWRHLHDRIDQIKNQSEVDRGIDIAKDVWEFYVDPNLVKRHSGLAISDHREYFGVPLSTLSHCHERTQNPEDGTCIAYDNLMHYAWAPDAKGVRLDDPKDWFVHVIPQYYGEAQPDMERFIKEGDIAAFFNPEDRENDVRSLLQWRSTHAATIMEQENDGRVQLLCVDTPSSYGRPFYGKDDRPFHVFRFVPDSTNWPVSDVYGQQIARWATLAFDKFYFQNDYQLMAGSIKTPDEIDQFVNAYLDVADIQDTSSGRLPDMYGAWFTFMNLNLAWMRPFSRAGLGEQRYDELSGKRFAGLRATHSYAKGNFDLGYRVPEKIQSEFLPQEHFAFSPFTLPELILGLVTRIANKPNSSDRKLLATYYREVANMLQRIAEDQELIRSFQLEPNFRSPTKNQTVNDYNRNARRTFAAFSALYMSLADRLKTEDLDEGKIRDQIRDRIQKTIKSQWSDVLEVPRRWIPPYGFMLHADNVLAEYTVEGANHPQEGGSHLRRPVLMYVGTVIHEKFLRRKGEAIGSYKMKPLAKTEETAVDKALDKEIYSRLGCQKKADGKGYKMLKQYLDPSSDKVCGQTASIKFNEQEFKFIKTMENDWLEAEGLSEKQILVRNTFGLDPVLMRRLLVSFWNDPTEVFKPAIHESEWSSVSSAVQTLRVLLQDPIEEINRIPADLELLDELGHQRRTRAMVCMRHTQPVSEPSCRRVF